MISQQQIKSVGNYWRKIRQNAVARKQTNQHLLATIKNKMDECFHFTLLKNKPCTIYNDCNVQELLEKWSMKNELQVTCWAFNEPYQPHRWKNLIQNLLQQPHFRQQLPWKSINEINVVIEPVPTTITSLEFFDRLLDPANGVVRRGSDGEIRGCFEEVFNGFSVSNELRQMLLNENSEVYPLYSRSERKELLFCLLQHLALGGQWCQYEDTIQPYIRLATALYKDILSVQKGKDDVEIEIRSKCFRLAPHDAGCLQDFAYILIDPGLREIAVITHKF